MALLVSYTLLDWLFISVQFFVLNLDNWFGVLSSKFIFFDILLSYYYTNLNSSIIFCMFSGDMYLSFGISISLSSVFECIYFEAFCK